MSFQVFYLDLEEGSVYAFLFEIDKEKSSISNVFYILEYEDLYSSNHLLNSIYENLNKTEYKFVLKDKVLSIEKDAENDICSFEELFERLIIKKDCGTTLENILKQYNSLTDIPKIKFYEFDDSLVNWEKSLEIIIGGSMHTLKFQTKELQDKWRYTNNGDILQDFIYKIYESENHSFVWYFTSEEERSKFDISLLNFR